MVVKIYISGISGNKEVKKRQQRVLMILDSRNIKYGVVDIAEPGNEEQKDFMQNNSTSLGATVGDANPRHALPPQIFNDEAYCGDYDQFDLANEIDEIEKFLKLAPDDSAPTQTSNAEIKLGNGTQSVEETNTENDDKTEEIKINSEETEEIKNEGTEERNDKAETNGDNKVEENHAEAVPEKETESKEEETPMKEEETPKKEEETPLKKEGTPMKEEETPMKIEGTPMKEEEGTPMKEEEGTPMKEEEESATKEVESATKKEESETKEENETVDVAAKEEDAA